MKEVIRIFGSHNGGLIGRAEIGADVPLENAEASYKAFYKHGVYRMRFCEIKGNSEKEKLLDSVYNVLDGKDGGENLLQLYRPIKGGIFVEGPRWEGVWTHNTFVGMMGWLPFLETEYRRFHRNSIEL